MHDRPLNNRRMSAAARPKGRRYFPAPAIENARQTLVRVIERGEGIGVVIGPSGVGKTLLLESVAAQLCSRIPSVLLSAGELTTRRSLWQAILFELGQPYRGLDDGELRLTLVEALLAASATTGAMALLVDEAQSLSWRLLESLRTLTNLTTDGRSRVRLVLAGTLGLEERLAQPRMQALASRLAARCYLSPMSRAETADFVRAMCSSAATSPTFSDAAITNVHRLTDGVQRAVNQLCGALIAASAATARRSISVDDVEATWAEFEQMPATDHRPTAPANAGHIVEFGSLDDGDNEANFDPPSAIPMREPFDERPTPMSVASAESMESLEAIDGEMRRLEEYLEPTAMVRELGSAFISFAGVADDAEFEDEELIFDRYTVAQSGSFAGSQVVSSREGHELSAQLSAMAPQAVAESTDGAAIPPKVASFLWPAEGPEHMTEPDLNAEWPSETPSRVERATLATYDELDPSDADLIIVEEDPVSRQTVEHVVLVRRQDYGQLFANLRKGSGAP